MIEGVSGVVMAVRGGAIEGGGVVVIRGERRGWRKRASVGECVMRCV